MCGLTGKAVLAEQVERLQVGGLTSTPSRGAQGVSEQAQAALGAEARVEQLEGAGGQVARVGVGLQPLGRCASRLRRARSSRVM